MWQRAEARGALLAALPGADPWAVVDLVGGLSVVAVTAEERAEARGALLAALPGANPWVARPSVVETLRSLSSIDSWLAWLAGMACQPYEHEG